MKTNTVFVYLLLLWWCYIVYLLLNDVDALFVSLTITPPFLLILYVSLRSNNIILKLFMGFGFLAHAVGVPYFWLNRSNYTYSGWGAVKDFNFDIVNFIEIYVWVIMLFAFIALFTVALDKIKFPQICSCHYGYLSTRKFPIDNFLIHKQHSRRYEFLILMLIVFLGFPLSAYMAYHKIGITGLVSEELPFRLVGIMYYSRLILIPILLTWLYFKSRRSFWVLLLILFYSFFSGISSASRTVLLLSLLPLVIDVIYDKKLLKKLVIVLYGGIAFTFVGLTRDYTYLALEFSYYDLLSDTYALMLDSQHITLISFLGGFANRFYGAQDMVLAYQYQPSNLMASFFQYFISGGRADSVIPDLTYDFYGLTFDEKSGVGVGIGLVAYLLILSHSNILLLPLSSMVVAFLLSLGNRVLNWGVGNLSKEVVTPLSLFIGVLLAFSIYSSSLNYYYLYMILVFLFGIAVCYKNKYRFIFRINVGNKKYYNMIPIP